jgi:proteasome assembly chaperone (PAC2) family protein
MFICVLVTLLLLFGRIDAVAGAGILGTALGYLAGNGVAAKMGDPIVPIFKDDHHEGNP